MQMDSWVGKPTTARVTGDSFYYVESPADPAVERMENERVFKRKVMLSWVALIEDPGCIEAHLFMGTCAKDLACRENPNKTALKSAVLPSQTEQIDVQNRSIACF